MFDKLKNLFKKEQKPEPKVYTFKSESEPPAQVKKESSKKSKLTPKEQATLAGEPYIAITKIDLDPNDINNGAFDLDWNDKFLVNLVKQGYKMKPDDTDSEIVDRWFQTVCRNIALEVYEQNQADPTNRDMTSDMRIIRSRDIGNGRSEVS